MAQERSSTRGPLQAISRIVFSCVFAGSTGVVQAQAAKTQFAELARYGVPAIADGSFAVAFCDVDGDAAPDLVVGNWLGPTRLYANDGNGRFLDVTATRMPNVTDTTYSLAAGDVDGDRDLDLVLADNGPNRLYVNDGRGRFTDQTQARLPTKNFDSPDVALADLDGDRDLDVVFVNTIVTRSATNAHELYLNDGKGHFTDASARIPKDPILVEEVALGDVDGDGDGTSRSPETATSARSASDRTCYT